MKNRETPFGIENRSSFDSLDGRQLFILTVRTH